MNKPGGGEQFQKFVGHLNAFGKVTLYVTAYVSGI